MAETKRYLVHIKLGGDVPLRQRITETAPVLKDQISRLSRGRFQLAWTSDDGGSFAFFMMCDMPAEYIMGQLQSPGAPDWERRQGRLARDGSALTNSDSAIVLEIAEGFSGVGFGRAWTWLQRHLPE